MRPIISGFPTTEIVEQVYPEQIINRAVEAYRFFYPSVSMEGIWQGIRESGIQDSQGFIIFSVGPQQKAFTANADTPYGITVLDLGQRGPLVVDLPAGPYIGLIDTHHHRWITDLGIPGPDGGKGGRYLLLPPGYQGAIPQGYHVCHSSTFKVLLALRAIPPKGNMQSALESLRQMNIYPLDQANAPSAYPVKDGTGLAGDFTCLRWEDNLAYWQALHKILDAEPVEEEYRPMYGMLAPLGIEKGKPFTPDAHQQRILEQAAKKGREAMLVEAFASRRPDCRVWQDRQWEWVGLVPNNADFETETGLDLTARERWFIQAIVASPAMFRRKVGSGSLYWLGIRDQRGNYLDGGKTYKLTVPQPVPASLFWSVTAYDALTRSMVQTDQNRAALRSLVETFTANEDGSIDLYFGPSAPRGREGQWIKTIPQRGWFSYFRLYGPESAAFDGTWKPGDPVEVKG